VPIESIRDRFRSLYPASPEPNLFRAPGRVNLIGEHTDYNLGLVLPMAIDLDCVVAAASTSGGILRVYTENLSQHAEWPIDAIPSLKPRGDWSDRVAGIVWTLARRGRRVQSQDVLIDSAVPIGGGLSSSAALGVSLALAFGANPDELAHVAHTAETDFAGVPCGIMDQFVSAQAHAGGAILLDCRTLDWSTVSLPPDLAIVAVNSMVKHELGDSAYRTRVAECAEAARTLKISSLRDATSDDLEKLSGTPLKRARHVVTENLRVEAFASAAARADLETMGRLAIKSHQSLRDDYEVSCAELDFLVERALEFPGVLGARMTGGGFGGSTVNFVRSEAVQDFSVRIASGYEKQWGRVPQIHVCRSSAGAGQIF
jgi:galactokinase